MQNPKGPVMPHTTPDNTFVILCDWHGNVVWRSSPLPSLEVGDLAWSFVVKDDESRMKEAFAKTVSLRENSVIDIQQKNGPCIQIWLWPLDAPECAACLLCRQIPSELQKLTDREQQCLNLLAYGVSTRQVAEKLDISLSTVQTHLKRSREKLGVETFEALISFAARFCNPNVGPANFSTIPDHQMN